jgi:hypothetical protein
MTTILLSVPEMHNWRRKPETLHGHPIVDETNGHVGVIWSPTKQSAFEPVDGQNRLPSHRKITTTNQFPFVRGLPTPRPVRKTNQGSQAIDITVDARSEPEPDRLALNSMTLDVSREPRTSQHSRTGMDTALLVHLDVVSHKRRQWNAVPIEEDQHVRCCHLDRAIHDDGLSIALVLVPTMLNGKTC